MKFRVLAVDDNITVLNLLEKILGHEYDFHMAQTVASGRNLIKELLPHIIILDIMLGDSTGFELLSDIKSNPSLAHTQVIMLSAKKGPEGRTISYQLGAVNYMEKPFDGGELKALLSSLLSRQNSHSFMSTITLSNLVLDPFSMKVKIDDDLIKLTASEFKILYQLAKRIGQVYPRSELLEVIGPESLDKNDRLIDNHISVIRKKIKNSYVEIKTIYSIGYVLDYVSFAKT